MSKKSRQQLKQEITSGWPSQVSVGPQGIVPVKKTWMQDIVDAAISEALAAVGSRSGALFPPSTAGVAGVAGGSYTPLEQAIINAAVATIQENQLIIGAQGAALRELQGRISAIAQSMIESSAARTVESWSGILPDPATPTAADVHYISKITPGGVRRGVGTEISAENVANLVELWSTPVDAAISGSPVVVNDEAYFVDVAGFVNAWYWPGPGEEPIRRWRTKMDAPGGYSCVCGSRTLVAFDLSGTAYGINRTTGATVWTRKPDQHPAAAFFSGQAVIDDSNPAKELVFLTVSSLQETFMGLALGLSGLQASGSATGGAITAPSLNAQVVTIPGASFTDDVLHRELSLSGMADPANNLRRRIIIQRLSAITLVIAGTAEDPLLGSEDLSIQAGAEYRIDSPFARDTLGLADDPGFFPYPGASFVGSAHCFELDSGKRVWNDGVYSIQGEPGLNPGDPVAGTVVAYNISGSKFGWPADVPTDNGVIVFQTPAQDVFGNPRYAFGPGGGLPWDIYVDTEEQLFLMTCGEQHSAGSGPNGSAVGPSGIVCAELSTGKIKWRASLAQDGDSPDIFDDGLGGLGPVIDGLTGFTVTDIGPPDSDGFQLLTKSTGAAFTTDHAYSGRNIRISGAQNAANDGDWTVAEFVDASNIKALKRGGVAESGSSATGELRRLLDSDLTTIAAVVTAPNMVSKYVVAGGKDGRMYTRDLATGAPVFEKQFIQAGILGGFLNLIVDGFEIYGIGCDALQTSRETPNLNNTVDILNTGPGVVVKFTMDNAGALSLIWKREISESGHYLFDGPNAGQELTGRVIFSGWLENGVIYCKPLTPSTTLYAIDASDGSILHSIDTGERGLAAPIVSRGRVYTVSGTVYPTNWRFPLSFLQLAGGVPTGRLQVFGLPS